MGIVMIVCPKMGKAISTGTHIDPCGLRFHAGFFQSHVLSVVPHLARVVCRERMGLRLRPREL
jgi:hypothetical protein